MTILGPYDTFCNSQAAYPVLEPAGNLLRQWHSLAPVALMISLDWSILPAILIFIITVVALNYLLFRPVTRVQAEREQRTTGLISRSRQDLAHHLQLFDQYQATIKNARMEGYRLVDKSRSEALQYRNSLLEMGRNDAERLIQETRGSIQSQVLEAKDRLEREAQEMARRIASAILQRSA